MALAAVHTATNCGGWVLVARDGRAFGLEPWLLQALPPAGAWACPAPRLASPAFWGGRPDRVEWVESVLPQRQGAARLVLRGSRDPIHLAADEVAALLGLLDRRLAA